MDPYPSRPLQTSYGIGCKDMQLEADRARVLYGMDLGATAESAAEDDIEDGVGVRVVPPNNRVSYPRRCPSPLNAHVSAFIYQGLLYSGRAAFVSNARVGS